MRVLLIVFAVLGQTPIEDFNVFKPGEEGILYFYNPDADRPGKVWVTSEFFAWRELEKTIDAKDEQGYDEMEARGRMYRVESGTKVRIIKFHLGDRYSGTWVRHAYEIRILEGSFMDKAGWVLVEEVRPRPAITEPLDDPNDKSPSALARAILKRDKAIYKDLILVEMKAQAKAKKLPRTNSKRPLLYKKTFNAELKAVGAKYNLDYTTAIKVLEWGKKAGWSQR